MFAEFQHILHLFRHPDAAIVAEGFAHQREFTLLITMNGYTGRMNLREAGIGKEGTLPVALHQSRSVGIHCIGGKEIGIAISAGSKHNSVGTETLQFAGNKITSYNTFSLTVDNDEVEHLVAGITLDCAGGNFLIERCVCAQKQLLTGLTAGIKGTANLHTTERTVGEISAIFPCKRNTLGNTLVDNSRTNLCKTINIRFPAAVIASFDGIVKETIDGVVVVLIILCSVDTSLRGNGMCPARGITYTENLDIVPHLTEGSGGRCTAKAGSDDDYLKFTFIVWTYDPDFSLAPGPFFGKRPFRNFGNQFFVSHFIWVWIILTILLIFCEFPPIYFQK